jgi:hypothetical protein
LVIVNCEETGLDRITDLVLRQPIGNTLGGAVGVDWRLVCCRPGRPEMSVVRVHRLIAPSS